MRKMYFVISDIHGRFDEMITSLTIADMFDRRHSQKKF